MAFTHGLPHCAQPGCTKMPVVRMYGFKHNEYDDYCEEHNPAEITFSSSAGMAVQRHPAVEALAAHTSGTTSVQRTKEGLTLSLFLRYPATEEGYAHIDAILKVAEKREGS